MARRKLIEYLNDPLLLNEISIEEMKAWAKEVPYAGLVHRLLAQKIAMEEVATEEMERANTLAILTSANPEKTIQSIEDFKKLMLRSVEEANNELNATSKSLDESSKEDQKTLAKTTNHLEDLDEIEDLETDDIHSANEEEIIENDFLSVVDTNEEMIYSENRMTTHNEEANNIDEIHIGALDLGVMRGDEKEVEEADAESQELLDMDITSEPSPPSAAVADESGFSEWLKSLRPLAIKEKRSQDKDENAAVSETLASLLVKQGHKKRAIGMYQKLILKYPGKSSFFAAQIAKLKDG